MKRLNKKGFTLIELLAVIIILGVLLLVAIPTMNGFIDNAKKDTFMSTAKQYITTVRYSALQGDVTLPNPGEFTAVSTKDVELDQGSKKSAFDKPMNDSYTYVLITNTGTADKANYTYYYAGIDSGGNGMALTAEDAMKRSDVKKGTLATSSITSLTTLNAAVEGGTKIAILPLTTNFAKRQVIMPSA